MLGIALTVGFFVGVARGIGNYYHVLTDVYGKKFGIAIGVALTLFWVVCIGAFGISMVHGVIEQYEALNAMTA